VTVFEAPAARALRRGSRGAESNGVRRGVTGCNGVRGRNERGAVVFLFLFSFSFPNILCELRLY
ncbi:hypothetical protein, partial [uncultured Alistipes sp.]|uniref:hypothetical protein n=1 Tax=uncultured Alistipes sp. TaxID=538949 RepID=UPI00263BD28B